MPTHTFMQKMQGPDSDANSWQYQENIQPGQESNRVIKPSGAVYMTCQIFGLSPSNTGKIQFTLDSVFDVINDTAEWHDWPKGVVDQDTGSTARVVTAVKALHVSGGSLIKFRVTSA